ncbi:hypothetical protein K469DRAFT_756644 [Zopfia rhizophila CBS 207.26]|uniref:Uncharacterized protein n=1 Tax=Zopfia rhizophila CBS 207.26 TaxID=1314779 RepID=A0A6A6D8S4_9PEZI|nr:hypothetical protein K469DRAFT_756644 [Zopfia rhizophila CBS 207.26]
MNSAVNAADVAVNAIPQNHPDRAAVLNSLGNRLGRRLERTGSMEDLNRAVDVADMAVNATPQDHPDRAAVLNNLRNWLSMRFKWTGSMEDLNRAVDVADMAVNATPQDHPNRAAVLNNLGNRLGMRFERTGLMEDLNRAVDVADMAVNATPQDHPDQAAVLNNLGNWLGMLNTLGNRLRTRFERTGLMEDLNRAVDVADMAVNATPQDHPDRATILNNLGNRLGMRFERTGSMEDLNRAVDVADMAVNVTPRDHPDRAARLNNLGISLGRRFERTGSMEDLNRAVDVADMAVNATPQDHPNRAAVLNNLGNWLGINWLGMRFERTGLMEDLNRAVDVADMAVNVTPQDHPDKAGRLNNLGDLLRIRFKRMGLIDDLNRAVEVAHMAVDATSRDRPDRAGGLNNLGNFLSMRYERTGAMEDLNLAADVARMVQAPGAADVDETLTITSTRDTIFSQSNEPTHSSHTAEEIERDVKRDLGTALPHSAKMKQVFIWVDEQLQRRVVDSTAEKLTFTPLLERTQWMPKSVRNPDLHPPTHKAGSYLSAEDIAHRLATDRSARSDELQDRIASIKQSIFVLSQIKTKSPAIANMEGHLSELQEKIDTVVKAENLVSKLEEALPAIARLIHTFSRMIQGELSEMKERLSESEIRHAEEGQQKLRTILERISNTWDVRIFADLNDFCHLLDDRIDSVLTVTGSSQNAFANTAASYVSWRWGQRGMDILTWLSEFLSAARLSGPSTSHPFRMYGEGEDAEPVCIELQAQLCDEFAAPLSKCNVAIRVQWVGGRMEEYYVLVADVASQLAWIVASFKEPPDKGLSFTRAKIEDQTPTGDPTWNDENRSAKFWVLHDNALDMAMEEDYGRCWHQLFTGLNVAVGFPIPTRPQGMLGVELPLSVMTSFAGVSYPVAYKGGFVLKGWRNALFPVRTDQDFALSETPSALQWHLLVGNKRPRLYMAEAKETEPKLLPFGTKLSPTEFCTAVEQTRRHFLGLYEDAKIHIGTNGSQADRIVHVRVDNRLDVTRLRSPLEWTRVFNVSFGGGAHGVSAGASTGFRIRTLKERQLSLDQERIQRQLLNATKTNSTVLFNVRTRVAWMLPQICVVMRLVQAWTTANYPNTQIDYPSFDDMSLAGLDSALQQFLRQPAAAAAHIELEQIFSKFATILDRLQDEEDLKPARRPNKRRLAGVDFAQLAGLPKNYWILTTDINLKSSGDWLQVLKSDWKDLETPSAPYRVITLFCDDLTLQPIQPRGHVCDTWYPPPVDQDYLITTMHCLKELTGIYGSDPVKLSREHVWERGVYGPYDRCDGRSCDRLQKIVTNGRRDKSISDMLSTGSYHAAVVFGGDFRVDRQRRCTSIVLQ